MRYFREKLKMKDVKLGTLISGRHVGSLEVSNDTPMQLQQKVSFETTTDKPNAEAAINAIYAQDGLANPLIIWTQSPMANIFAKVSIDYLSEKDLRTPWCLRPWRKESLDNNSIRARAWQSVCEAGWQIGGIETGQKAWLNLDLYQNRSDLNWVDIPPDDSFSSTSKFRNNGWAAIGDAIADRTNNDWLVDIWARFNFSKIYPDPNMYPGGSRSMHLRLRRDKLQFRHQKNLNCLPLEVGDIKDSRFAYPTGLCRDFQTLRDTAGWIMPYQNICFVSERSNHEKFDDQGRLHCETGPAIAYPDGFLAYAWHGTIFPEEWLQRKPTSREALKWRNVEQRRVACEMIGWDTILNELEAITVDKNKNPEIGELVSVEIPGLGEEKFLRVKCGTGRQFALPVPPKMKTAHQANAWTWGLKPHEYQPEVRT